MSRSADVVVIGGGVIGASVAYHLALSGVRRVVIVDGGAGPGAGSTGRATGGYRAQFATPVNVALSLYSRERLLEFRDATGVNPGYHQVGYLWVASSDREIEILRSARAVQTSAGLHNVVALAPDDVARLNPAISKGGVAGGAFCSNDGYIKPLEILRGYLEAAGRRGVEVRWGSPVRGLEVEAGRVRSVQLDDGAIQSGTVVNAAGPWAGVIAAMAGVSLPVVPLRRQAVSTGPTDALPVTMPLTIYLDTGFHFRVRDGRAVICWPSPGDPGDPFSTAVDPSWIDSVDAMKRQRIPALRDVPVERSSAYAGLYEMSPDHHAIVGFADECENMFLVNGSSGHGVMHSPALGAVAAAMVRGETSPLDVSELRPSRFAEGRPVATPELL